MRKMVGKVLFGAAMAMMMTSTALAAGWQKNDTGWWWQNDDGSWPANKWEWLDGNNDGVAECYYFNESGYMLANTKTPDGYWVNENGAWVSDGYVMFKPVIGAHAQEEKKQEEKSVIAGGEKTSRGWEQTAEGWKYKKEDGGYAVDTIRLIDANEDGVYEIYSFDSNGLLYQNTTGNEASNYNKFGNYDEEGRILTRNYRGGTTAVGPCEVVKKADVWHCVNGTLPEGETACGYVTGDYMWDAYSVKNGISDTLLHMESVSYTEHRTIYVD